VPFAGVKTPRASQSMKGHQPAKSPRPYRFALKTEMEQMAIQPLGIMRQLQPGDTVVDSKGQSYQIGEKEMVNNGATTYSTSREDMWVKLYDIKLLNTFTEAKIQRMLRVPLQQKGLCWPLDVARDADGAFRGFFMPRAAGEPLHLCVFKRSGVETYFPDWDKRDICELTLTILETIKYLHTNTVLTKKETYAALSHRFLDSAERCIFGLLLFDYLPVVA